MTSLIERVRELNEKRTPGDWIAGVHPGNQRLNIIRPICFGKYVGKLPECEGGAVYFLHEANAQFIALAPAMAEALLEQHRQLQIARETLEYYAEYENPIEAAPAKQALHQLESLARVGAETDATAFRKAAESRPVSEEK